VGYGEVQDSDEKILTPVESFIFEYGEKLDDLIEEAREALVECYCEAGKITRHNPFSNIEDELRALQSLSCLNEKIKAIGPAKEKCYTAFSSATHGKVSDGVLNTFYDIIEGIEKIAKDSLNYTIKIAGEVLTKILACQMGKQNNDHQTFQEKVLEFFEWLFIFEMQRLDVKSFQFLIGRLKLDGAFKVTNEFKTEDRCDLKFTHILIECKNLKNPNYHALYQTFNYSLQFRESISKIPLSLLISRKNPQQRDTTWKIRKYLFNKSKDDWMRLILFLDEIDLQKMLAQKSRDGDHALVLMEKLDELDY
jgi:hypothetical protein